MDLSSRFSAALAAISPELVAEDNYCALTVDARLVLHVALDDHSGAVIVWSNFPLLPVTPALQKRLLHANYFWQGTGGSSWSLDPNTDTPMLAERLSTQQWDSPALDELLQRFADRAMAWQTELGDTAEESAAAEHSSAGSFSSESFGNPFLRA
ncbi:type III secretion system chaperone [Pigmentiphaga aceris]|nr:type III secretion system chaperone [Pigmentiphaga aceris]